MPAETANTFAKTLKEKGLTLVRDKTATLQVNVGLVCNLACRHCHLEAGPARTEAMDKKTMDEVVAWAARGHFDVADVTGGAPEMVPDVDRLILGLAPHVKSMMFRSNLVAMGEKQRDRLLGVLKETNTAIVASFPALTQAQVEAQRGKGVFDASLDMLKRLNEQGWGMDGGPALHLVSNPAGAFMPPDQDAAEKRFKRELMRKAGISFNNLFVFANVPLGRYRAWLKASGNLKEYLDKLAEAFNPCAVEGVMCRNLVSVAWDGHLYDCDFNLAARMPLGGRPRHVSEMEGPPEPGSRIATAEHCFACTAGAGFT